uniref:Phosphoinositide phospholipase C n=1 Tax=Medicago truncatula TaxID=3880 RepID=B7FLN6_MEDTR|nr:unknown [Medicago truncatula]
MFSKPKKHSVSEAPPEIKEIYHRYSDEGGIMTASHLRSFLIEVQKEEKITEEETQAIIDHRDLNLESFFKFLFGDNNPPLLPSTEVHQDMSLPLSHYYIFTGHNSYLTGNQLSSDCSDAPIIEALQRGVRVIELDIWPNDSKDDVDVLHGMTLTTPVALIKCLLSIKEYAFVASEYPVVITLEDHLTPDLQAKVAQMVTQTFGDILFCPTSETLKDFPHLIHLKKGLSSQPSRLRSSLKLKKKRKRRNHRRESL